jgi:hypothetical protein
VVSKFIERLLVSRRASQYLDIERLNLKKLSDSEVQEQYRVKIKNRFVPLENLDIMEKLINPKRIQDIRS